MAKAQRTKILLLVCMSLALAIGGCGGPPADEPGTEGPPSPEPVQEQDEEEDEGQAPMAHPDSYRWEVEDKRADKTPLDGKYLLDCQLPEGPDDWAERHYLEIHEDCIFIGNAMASHGGTAVIGQHEGLTWICFPGAGDGNGGSPLNFYLYRPGVIIKESSNSDLFNVHTNAYYLVYKREDILLEERQGQGASGNGSGSVKALLGFDPASFGLDTTIGEIRRLYRDLHCEWYESGSLVYYSGAADKYYRINAGVDDPDAPPDDMKVNGYGSKAKNIFPNMGAWVFKEEIRGIADRYCEGLDTLDFTLEGYDFTCRHKDSYDMTPDTLVMVHETYVEEG